MAKLYNLARMTTTTIGVGQITLAAAVPPYFSFVSAGVQDGDVVSYSIIDGPNAECGTGTYTAAGTTLSRTPVISSNSNAAINLSGAAQVFITALAADFNTFVLPVTFDSSITVLGQANFDGPVVVTGTFPEIALNSTVVGSWKSWLSFQDNGTEIYEIGVDVAGTGQRQVYFYDDTSVNAVIGTSGVGIGTTTPGYLTPAGVQLDVLATTPLQYPFNFTYGPSTGNTAASAVLSRMTYQDGLSYTGSDGSALIDALSINHILNAGTGGRQTLYLTTDIPNGSTWAASSNAGANKWNVITFVPSLTIENPLGGGSGTELGGLFTMNPGLNVGPLATYLQEVCVSEHNLVLQNNSTQYASLLKLAMIKPAGTGYVPSTNGAYLVFTQFGAGGGLQNIMTVGGWNETSTTSPCSASGCSILTLTPVPGSSTYPGFKYGIDFNNANPQSTDLSAGFPFRSGINSGSGATTKFSVDWSGNIIGANGTFKGNGSVVGGTFGLSGNFNHAIGTAGSRYVNVASTITDTTTAAGTVALGYTDLFGGNTIATQTNAVTVTNYYAGYFKAPVAGSNVTFTNSYALGADSMNVASGGVIAWNSDTGISRLGAASFAFGNGTNGDFSATLKATTYNATTGYQVNGTALAASNLSNGVTGSGAVVGAAGNPALTWSFPTVTNSSSGEPQFILYNTSTDATGPYYRMQKGRGAGGTLNVNDAMGVVAWYGYDATAGTPVIQEAAIIQAAAAAVGSGNVDGALQETVFGAASYIRWRTNNTTRMQLFASGGLSLSSSPSDPGAGIFQATGISTSTFGTPPANGIGSIGAVQSNTQLISFVTGGTIAQQWINNAIGSSNTDANRWDLIVGTSSLVFRATNDAQNAETAWLTVTRTATNYTLTGISFGAPITVLGGTNPLLTSATSITTGAGSSAGTLTNAPSVGNPTKWIPINDNGTTRYIPAW